MRSPTTTILAVAAANLLGLTGASTLEPPVLPLVVRNPYLSTWLANAREEPWSQWPMFYTGSSVSIALSFHISTLCVCGGVVADADADAVVS